MSRLQIDPDTLLIDGLRSATFTAEQFAEIEPPACLVCGATVELDRIDITWNAEEEKRQGRTYMAGMWHCPHDCDPRTMRRMHYSQGFERGIGYDGVLCKCTCGDVTGIFNNADLAAWRAEHRSPSASGGKPLDGDRDEHQGTAQGGTQHEGHSGG